MMKLSLASLTTPWQNWVSARQHITKLYQKTQAANPLIRLKHIPALLKHPTAKTLYTTLNKHLIADGRWLWIIGVCIASIIFHILIVLSIPSLSSKTAWDRLDEVAPINQIYVAPRASHERQLLPYMAPDIRYALCRFDLTEGPVKVTAPIQSANWSIALYSRYGENFYAISGADLRRVRIQMVLVDGERATEAEADIAEAVEELVIVKSPHRQGVLVIRAPLSGQSYEALTDQAIRQASCGTR